MVRFNQNYRQLTTVIRDEENWQDDESVTLRTYYGDGDRRRILSLLSTYRQHPDGEVETVSTIEKAYAARRFMAIKSWTLKDEDGKLLPLTEDIVANLPVYVCSYIDSRLDEFWQDLLAPPKSTEEEAEEQADQVTFSDEPGKLAGGAEDSMGEPEATGAGARRRGRGAPS